MASRRVQNLGIVDRQQAISFQWDGKTKHGFKGDTLASALLANNEKMIARSFKYHRPRGIMSAGVEESGALISIGEGAHKDPNVKASCQELYQGLYATGQNAWPSVRFDLGAINNVFGRFFAAGFYYKTFMGLPPFEWGKGTYLWMQYEKIIRRAAGMGEASREPDPDQYEHGHLFCDVLVVGSGPAGLSAALRADDLGLDVILVEQDFELGGDLLNQSDGQELHQRLLNQLAQSNVRCFKRTSVFGLYDHGVSGLLERVTDHLAEKPEHLPRQRFWTLRSKQTIVASGALERHIAYHNNDLPGTMTANSARAYLNRYGVLAGDNIVIAANNDSAFASAIDLAHQGASVTLLDARDEIDTPSKSLLDDAGIDYRLNSSVLAAKGRDSVKQVSVGHRDQSTWRKQEELDCDSLLISGGWSPIVNLISHKGVRPQWDDFNACFLAREAHQGVQTIGSAAGIWNTFECLQSGEYAAEQAAISLGKLTQSAINLPSAGGWDNPISALYEVKETGQKSKAFVDFQHDVSSDDVRLAHQEGFVSVEHLKRYTTLGMATDGGKMGNIIGLALMAEALGKDIPEVGTTVFRPPYTPVAVGALAGRSVGNHFRALRRTPLHDWNIQHGATMTMAGLWDRPWYFARAGESIDDAYIRETITTRSSVGICDVTSLGKIAVQGPDATEFLNRIYSNAFAKLAIGKARYGVMLRDDGIVMDDGTTWRISETEYFMTTTTVNAVKVMVWMEELLQTRWPDLKVHLTSVTEQWAGVAVAGPKSREVLQACVAQAELLSDEALPFMGVLETQLLGDIPVRIARISFSGERAFEVYTPSDYASSCMDMIHNAAQKFDGCLYGTEALGAMRIEKGHVTGAELDGRVSIEDAGLGSMASTKKSYIGSALKQRAEFLRDDRPQLVGIFPKDRSQTFKAGSLLFDAAVTHGIGDGWITAVTHSPTLGHWIGLGFISGGRSTWQGKSVVAADPVRDSSVEVEIVSPHMVDPSGERMHG